jgi:hypothetical protein
MRTVAYEFESALMEVSLETTSQNPVMNAFSIDVEGFVESNVQSFHIPDEYINQSAENQEIERNTDVLLQVFDEANVKATFFFLGRIARDIPGLVRKVAQAGHEIGCHTSPASRFTVSGRLTSPSPKNLFGLWIS